MQLVSFHPPPHSNLHIPGARTRASTPLMHNESVKSDDLSRLKIDRTAHGGPVRRGRNWLRYGIAVVVIAAAAAWAWSRFAAPPSVETATVAAVYPSQSYTML